MSLLMLLGVAVLAGVSVAVPLVTWQERVRDVAVILMSASLLAVAPDPAAAGLVLLYVVLAGAGSAAVVAVVRSRKVSVSS